MENTRLKAVSNQSADVYRLLSRSDNLTARQIAAQLEILPNAVYRAVKSLLALGMIEKIVSYPVSYRAIPTSSAMNWYLLAAAQSFWQDFGGQQAIQTDGLSPTITFIRNRQSLLTGIKQDARQATRSINYIISGHRIPDENILAFRKAVTVGARIRCIIQNTSETTNNGLERYTDIGIEVRYLPDIGIRLFVFDGTTTYLTSYVNTSWNKAFGIRFTYAPVATQLDQLFEQKWLQAKPLI